MQLFVSPGRNSTAREPVDLPLRLVDVGTTVLAEGEESTGSGFLKEFVEIVWVVSGAGDALLYDKAFPLRPNDVFYYMPGEDHLQRCLSGKMAWRWVCFDGPLATAVMSSYRYPRLQQASLPCPTGLFDEIAAGINSDSPIEQGLLVGKLLMILAMANGSRRRTRHPNPVIDRILQFLDGNLSNPELNITMIADSVGVPRSTLLKLFSDELGISLGRYIRSLRYHHALDLLRSTELPVGEIANRCGYAELTSFSRLIRRGTGMSPQECRRTRHEPIPLSREK
ncbi:MAG: AraC family transcriptional regulator [Lentisphaeria bacterium]|nr:AraC family transcriptional regulator [Lentisphaeria bacterium]